MHRYFKQGVALASVVVLTALAGCTGVVSPNQGGSSPGDTGKLDRNQSPLSQYMGPVGGSQDQQSAIAEQFKKADELVAQCMKKEGFDYTPGSSGMVGTIVGSEDDSYKPDDRDWVTRYGYGITNSPAGQAISNGGSDTSTKDPNQAYQDSLSPAEQKAYLKALFGKSFSSPEDSQSGTVTVTTGGSDYKWEDGGCQGWAQHEAQGGAAVDQTQFKPLLDAVDKFYQTSSTSPEYASLDAEWAKCMDGAGHPGFTTQRDAQASIFNQIGPYFQARQSANNATPDPNLGTLKDPDFAKLNQQEIALALTDLDCREKIDYLQRQLKIQFALEEQFIADHAAELKAFKASQEQK